MCLIRDLFCVPSVPACPALLVACLVLPGCDADSTPGTVVVDTLAGGHIVVLNPAPDELDEPSRPDEPNGGATWRLVEELRIGRRSGSGPEVFGRIVGLELAQDGRTYVADGMAHEVRLFDAEGAHVRSFGREGDGPGEFRMISGMVLDPTGVLWVLDPSSARLSAFGGDGALLATHARGPFARHFATIPWAGRLDSLGRLYDREPQPPDSSGAGKFLVRYALHPESGLEPLDSLFVPDIAVRTYASGEEAMRVISPVPFSPTTLTAIAPDGDVWIASSAAYRLHRVNFHGDTVRTIEVRQPPLRVTDRERDSLRVVKRLRERDLPEHKPILRFFTVDDEGRLWVQPALGGVWPVWDILEPDGTFLRRVRTSLEFATDRVPPLMRAGRIVGVVEDSLGVQYVVRARMERVQP